MQFKCNKVSLETDKITFAGQRDSYRDIMPYLTDTSQKASPVPPPRPLNPYVHPELTSDFSDDGDNEYLTDLRSQMRSAEQVLFGV